MLKADTDASGDAESAEGVESADMDTIVKWIERYYEEKLDRRDRRRDGPGAGGYKGLHKGLLMQMLTLN